MCTGKGDNVHGEGKRNEQQSERRKLRCWLGTRVYMEERASSEEEKEKSKTLPLRQRAERNRRGRQSRTLLSHNRTKRRGASWESEPCAAADAMLDGNTH